MNRLERPATKSADKHQQQPEISLSASAVMKESIYRTVRNVSSHLVFAFLPMSRPDRVGLPLDSHDHLMHRGNYAGVAGCFHLSLA